jgi:hypothetical protein
METMALTYNIREGGNKLKVGKVRGKQTKLGEGKHNKLGEGEWLS